MNTVRLISAITGAFLVILAVFNAIFSNMTVGVLLVVLFGAVLFVWGAFNEQVKILEKSKAGKIIKILIASGMAFALCLCLIVGIYGNIDTVKGNEDIILVLGCGVNGERPTQPLVDRLDVAIDEYEKNPDAYILVSGGQGPQEHISEAEAMYRYLKNAGISEEKIIKEDKSTSTSENYKFSKKIIEERFGECEIAVVTNDFHMYRAKSLAKLAGLEITTAHAPTKWYIAPVVYAREVLAIIKLWIFKY